MLAAKKAAAGSTAGSTTSTTANAAGNTTLNSVSSGNTANNAAVAAAAVNGASDNSLNNASNAANNTAGGATSSTVSNAANTSANNSTSNASGSSSAADMTSGNSDSKTESKVLGAYYEELFGDSLIAYSEKTGKYELLDTEKLFEGKEMKRTDALAEKTGIKDNASDSSALDNEGDAAQDTDGEDDHFSVAWGINRSLDAAERQGFLLIALASGIGIAVLAVLYIKVIRKRKK